MAIPQQFIRRTTVGRGSGEGHPEGWAVQPRVESPRLKRGGVRPHLDRRGSLLLVAWPLGTV